MDSRTAGIHVGPAASSRPQGALSAIVQSGVCSRSLGPADPAPITWAWKVALCLLCALTYPRAPGLLSGGVR